jgi:hypothetical protein
MALGRGREARNLIDGISDQTVNALNFGNVTARITRSVDVDPVNGIGLSVSQTVNISDEFAQQLIDPDHGSKVGLDLFPTPFGTNEERPLWLCTDGEMLSTPSGSMSTAIWQISQKSGWGVFDPRDLEYAESKAEGYSAKVADIAGWVGAKLLENPTFDLLEYATHL